jgi:hypothetical protein
MSVGEDLANEGWRDTIVRPTELLLAVVRAARTQSIEFRLTLLAAEA